MKSYFVRNMEHVRRAFAHPHIGKIAKSGTVVCGLIEAVVFFLYGYVFYLEGPAPLFLGLFLLTIIVVASTCFFEIRDMGEKINVEELD